MPGPTLHYRAERVKSKVLHASAKLFLEKGYADSTLREIAEKSGVKYGSLNFVFKGKENILGALVGLVLESQFEATEKLLEGKTDDKVFFYATETVLQLYIAESSEHMRELYSLSYSLRNPSDIIYNKITIKLSELFKERYPDFRPDDFYEKELASAGIMRNYLSRPCDIFFTMDRKVRAFLENTFLLFEISHEKIEQAIEFVAQFDFEKIAQEVIDNMFEYLESRT